MKRQRGFNLVEMLVVLVIIAILLGLGLPSYRTYMANQRVLSTAEVFMAGIQMARGEAVKINRRVEFILTNDEPVVANVDTTNVSSGGRSWMVRGIANAVAADIPSRALVVGGNTFIEGKSGAEGSGAATSTASLISVASGTSGIGFDGFGMPFGGVAWNFEFSYPLAGDCAAAGGPVRCLRVVISRGGQARLCDPAVPNTDTRRC